MSYKNVFFIWLWADIILIVLALIFAIGIYVTDGNQSGSTEILLMAIAYGFLLTVPSLLILLVFHYFFNTYASNTSNYKQPYLLLIISINIIYALVGRYSFTMPATFSYLHIITTLAGIAAFYLVDRKIHKAISVYKD
jgi:hypothetical protein